jgi:hypothetical protein
MNDALNPDLKFLNGSQMVEAAATLDAVHTKTLKVIERLQKDVDARKRAIAARWQGTGSFGLQPADVQRASNAEANAAVMEIRRNAEKELDALLKEAGAAHSAAVGCRGFYDSPVKTLNRLTLGDAKRGEYMRQVESVGPAELQHLGQLAVSTGNLPLAAALVTRLDVMPASSRPFGAVALAEAMRIEEHRRGVESLRIADVRLQSILVAIRTWKAGRDNPLSTVQLALRNRELDTALLDEMEADNARAG